MDVKTIWDKLQAIDPKILYVTLVAFIVLPLLFGVTIPGIPSMPAKQGFDTVERVAKARPNDLVLFASDWSASTRGESHWQDLAALRQVMRHHLRFAVLPMDPQTRSLMSVDIDSINDEIVAGGGKPYVYGRDYCLWGYKPSTALPQFLKGLVNDVPGTVRADYRGTPIASLPCMDGVRTTKDVSMIVMVTGTSLLDTFLQFVVAGGSLPLVYFPTSVMAPEGYPYLDSHQIAGMITGVKGAGDYEQLENVNGFGRKISTALSLVYLLILLLILIGNVSYYVGRVVPKREGAAS